MENEVIVNNQDLTSDLILYKIYFFFEYQLKIPCSNIYALLSIAYLAYKGYHYIQDHYQPHPPQVVQHNNYPQVDHVDVQGVHFEGGEFETI